VAPARHSAQLRQRTLAQSAFRERTRHTRRCAASPITRDVTQPLTVALARACVPVCGPARELLLRHDQVRAHLQHRHLATRRRRAQRRRRNSARCIHLWRRWRKCGRRRLRRIHRRRRRRRRARLSSALCSQPRRLGCERTGWRAWQVSSHTRNAAAEATTAGADRLCAARCSA
jgi:hypothetical protein